MVKDKYLAEDIFQDLFIKIIENLKSGNYKEENKFLFWAMRIAHHLCVDHFRKIKSRPVIRTSNDTDIFDVLDFAEPNAEESIMKSQSRNQVMQLVSLLPEEQREVLNCSVNTALGRMRYALLNIRKMVEEKELAL